MLGPISVLATEKDEHQWEIWVNKDGQHLKAELIEQRKWKVVLLRHDDLKRFSILISDLSQADQDYLKKRTAAIEKREAGITQLQETFPLPLTKPIYRAGPNNFSFKLAKKNDPVYKSLTVTQDGFYLRYERNFRFIELKNFDRQLENIEKTIKRDRNKLAKRTGGSNMIDLGAQLDLEWLDKSLQPYYQKWTQLEKQTRLPTKPPPPKPKAATAPQAKKEPQSKSQPQEPVPKEPAAPSEASPAPTQEAPAQKKDGG
ncbi:MAG: hypothetical protein AAGA45_02805 [Verrucomicrobiota bacterium]